MELFALVGEEEAVSKDDGDFNTHSFNHPDRDPSGGS